MPAGHSIRVITLARMVGSPGRVVVPYGEGCLGVEDQVGQGRAKQQAARKLSFPQPILRPPAAAVRIEVLELVFQLLALGLVHLLQQTSIFVHSHHV